MKFEISSKELKNVITGIEKAVTKKATLEIFETVQFRREGKGNIVFEAQNMNGDAFGVLRLLNTEVCDFESSDNKESFNLDLKDLKEIVKIKTDDFIVSEVSDNKVLFDAEKKKVVVNKKTNNSFVKPDLEDMELICTTTCKDLLDSFTRLSKVLDKDNNRKTFRCYHLCNNFIESLDEYQIMRKATNEKETCFYHDNTDLLINGKDFEILKNVLIQNKDNKLHISINHKYYCISCEAFSYIGQRVEGIPFNTDKFFEGFGKNVVVDTADFLEIVKYNAKINRNSKEDKPKPTILGIKGNQLFSYHSVFNLESFDVIETKENNVEDGFYIAVNPDYLQKVFSILAEDKTEMTFLNKLAPVRVESGDITSLILPVYYSFDFNSINKFFED